MRTMTFLVALNLCLACFVATERGFAGEDLNNLVANGDFLNVAESGAESDSGEPPLVDWKLIPIEASAKVTRLEKEPLGEEKESATCVSIAVEGLSSSGHACVIWENGGEKGFVVEQGRAYRLCFWAWAEGDLDSIQVVLPVLEGATLAEGTVVPGREKWVPCSIVLTPSQSYDQTRLLFVLEQTGTLRLAHVSLCPVGEEDSVPETVDSCR